MIDKFLNKLRESGMTQQEIADKCGLTQSMIGKYTRGLPCNVETLIKIAKAFGVSTDTVLGLEEPKEPDERRRTRKPKANSRTDHRRQEA